MSIRTHLSDMFGGVFTLPRGMFLSPRELFRTRRLTDKQVMLMNSLSNPPHKPEVKYYETPNETA